jgi:hypothetical protein
MCNIRTSLAFVVLIAGILACGRQSRKELVLYPTTVPNATETSIVVQITSAPIFVVVSGCVSMTPWWLSTCVRLLTIKITRLWSFPTGHR